MDQARFEELKKKRFEQGLSDEEADELGRMFAEEEGQPYQSAGDYQEAEEAERATHKQPEEGTVEDRPETAKDVAESRPPPVEDLPGGTREPLWAREEEAATQEE